MPYDNFFPIILFLVLNAVFCEFETTWSLVEETWNQNYKPRQMLYRNLTKERKMLKSKGKG